MCGVAPEEVGPADARRRRWSTTGSPTACRHSGSRTGSRSRAGGGDLPRALLRALPRHPAVHRRDDRHRGEEGLRLHAPGPQPGPSPSSAPASANALAWRAAGGEHGDPGHGRRHHQARDAPMPRGAGRRRDGDWSRPQSTSSCSRGPGRRQMTPRRSSGARCARQTSSIHRSPSTSESAPTGWRRSRRSQRAEGGHRPPSGYIRLGGTGY